MWLHQLVTQLSPLLLLLLVCFRVFCLFLFLFFSSASKHPRLARTLVEVEAETTVAALSDLLSAASVAAPVAASVATSADAAVAVDAVRIAASVDAAA